MRTALLLSLALTTACIVPKKKYDALQAELDEARATMKAVVADKDATIQSLESALAEEKENVATLDGRIAQLQEDLAARKAEIDTLQGEKAALVKDRSRLKASVQEIEQALIELAERKAAADKRLSAYQELLERFKEFIDAGKLRVRIVDGQMVLEMATDILFESGSAELSEDGKAALTEIAGLLAQIPERRFQVAGHTDTDPISTKQYPSNWYLGAGRALVVVDTLVAGGVAPDRVSGASYGEFQPRADNDSDENKAMNRRIEIVVVPDLSQLPGFDELNAATEDG